MTEREMLIAKANEEVEIQRMLADACEDEDDLEGAAACMKLVILLRNLVAALTQQQEAEPYGYLRENDGAIQISIGSERPADRSGAYATPWAAIYARPPQPAAQPDTEASLVANALEAADWSGVPIGNKCFIRGAIEHLRAAQPQVPEGIQQIGWTNAAQVSYVKDDSGIVYPDQDHGCNIPVFIPVPPPEWKPACGCRFENEYSSSVLLCSACGKLPCHNRLSAAKEES